MQANDAMRILGSAAAMGLLGGGGALAYNATTKPILDEYGNVIESNDINPIMAALGSAAIGAVGSGIYGKMNQPVAKPVQGVSVGTSPKPQQSPDIDIDVTPTWQEDVQKEIDVFRNEVANLRGQLLQKRNDYAQGVNDLREASIPIRQVVPAKPDRANGLFEVPKEYEGFTQVLGKDGKKYVRVPNGQGSDLIRLDDLQGGTTSEKRFVPQLSSEQEALYAEAKRLGISSVELEERGWKYNPNQPTVKVVPASPMQMQNPMTPPGMRTVVIQPVKEPAQESADELMALQNLAGLQGNPSNLVNEYFDPSPNVRTFVQDVYSPEEKYLYSQIGQKQYQNPDKLPRLIQQPVRPGQEEFIATRRQVAGNAPGWNVVSADTEAAAYSKELGERQRPQNLQPVEPGQEMIEEALRLKELARRQSNPSVPYDVFGESDGYWEAQKKRA